MPEEVNRRIVDYISWLLFASTLTAIYNLKNESVLGDIFQTRDVHVDMLQQYIDTAEKNLLY